MCEDRVSQFHWVGYHHGICQQRFTSLMRKMTLLFRQRTSHTMVSYYAVFSVCKLAGNYCCQLLLCFTSLLTKSLMWSVWLNRSFYRFMV